MDDLYIVIISIFNFMAISQEDANGLTKIIISLSEKQNPSPQLTLCVVWALLTHSKILPAPFHELMHIYKKNRDATINNNALISQIASVFESDMPLEQTWYAEDLVIFYDALRENNPLTNSLLINRLLTAFKHAQKNPKIVPEIKNILEHIHTTTTLDNQSFLLLLEACLKHLNLEDMIRLYDPLCMGRDKTMQYFVANTLAEQLSLNQITCEHPILHEYQTAHQEQQQLLKAFDQHQFTNLKPVLKYSLNLLNALNDGRFYNQLTMPEHLNYTQLVIEKLNELQKLSVIQIPLSETAANQQRQLESSLEQSSVDLNALETFFDTLKDDLNQFIQNQHIKQAEHEQERQIESERNQQKTYIINLKALLKDKPLKIQTIKEVKNILNYFEQSTLIYFQIELDILSLEFAIIEQNTLNAAKILERLSDTPLKEKQQDKVNELRFKFLNLSGNKQGAIALLDTLILPKFKHKNYKRIEYILNKAEILVKLNRIDEAYLTLKQEGGILGNKNMLHPVLQRSLEFLYCRISILKNEPDLAMSYLKVLYNQLKFLDYRYYNLVIMYQNKFKDNILNIETIAKELIKTPHYYLFDRVYSSLLTLELTDAANMFLEKIQEDMPDSRIALSWQLQDQFKKQRLSEALETADKIKPFGESWFSLPMLAILYEETEELAEAIRSLKKIPEESRNEWMKEKITKLEHLVENQKQKHSTISSCDRHAPTKDSKLSPEIKNELEHGLATMQQHGFSRGQLSIFAPRENIFRISENLKVEYALQHLYFLKDNHIPFYLVGSCLFAILNPQHEAATDDIDVVVPFHQELDLANAGFNKSNHINGLYTRRILTIDQRHYTIDLFMHANSKGVTDFIKHDYLYRDFTISCLYGKPHETNNDNIEIIDPTGQGIADFKNKILRTVAYDQTHLEADPVRALRAIKWISRGYKPTNSLVAALSNCSLRHADENQIQHCHAYASNLLQKNKDVFIQLLNEYCPQYVETLCHQEDAMPLSMTYG